MWVLSQMISMSVWRITSDSKRVSLQKQQRNKHLLIAYYVGGSMSGQQGKRGRDETPLWI